MPVVAIGQVVESPVAQVVTASRSASGVGETVNQLSGRRRGGRGFVVVEVPVVEPGPRVQRRPVRVVTYSLPAPTLVNGRPV